MVKTLPSKAVGVSSIPGQGARSPHALGQKKKKAKTENRSSYVTNSIKTKNGSY